jgi:hypothetical protein
MGRDVISNWPAVQDPNRKNHPYRNCPCGAPHGCPHGECPSCFT